MKRVLVLRAREDAERTAAKLRAMGFEPLISPVLEIARTDALAPQGAFDAALATSAKALEHLQDAGAAQKLPLHVVGARTAQIARELRWRPDLTAHDAASLLALICQRYKSPARFLYLAGRDRKPDLETGLAAAGLEATIVETYEARPATELTQEAAGALTKGEIAAALHYSRRSASIFVELARRAGLGAGLRRVDHFALSEEAAAPFPRAFIAEQPDEAHLLRLLQDRQAEKSAP